MSRRRRTLHGVLAEYESPESLVRAAREARRAGHGKADAYAPHPVEGLPEALDLPPSPLPRLVLVAGLVGAAGGFLLPTWTSVHAYPMNVGGRPHFAWPAFVVPAFECAILAAALAAVLGMFASSGLPRPHHPLFAIRRFERATQDGYFLCLEAAGPGFDERAARRLLEGLGAKEVWDVPA